MFGSGGGEYGYGAHGGGLISKLLRFDWLLAALLITVACVGFLMLYSVAGGSLDPWARAQIVRFTISFGLMMMIALIDIRFWKSLAAPLYLLGLVLLVLVELIGEVGMGAQRWIKIGPIQVQPSELMKVASVMALAAFYHWLPPERVSRPLWVLLALAMIGAPAILVLKQPDLGTALLLVTGGLVVMFLAGVTWWFFTGVFALAGGAVTAVMMSRGEDWQLLNDYQYRRIDTFIDPTSDPLGAGYQVSQSLTAIGSGGMSGKGLLNGTQTQLAFLPEPQTDFIFTTLAEEFGFTGALGLLGLYALIMIVGTISTLRIQMPYARLVAAGVLTTFFLFFAINMSMVMGLAPVVGVPLPLVSYGGTSMLSLMCAFGLMMSASIHGHEDR